MSPIPVENVATMWCKKQLGDVRINVGVEWDNVDPVRRIEGDDDDDDNDAVYDYAPAAWFLCEVLLLVFVISYVLGISGSSTTILVIDSLHY